MALDLRYHVRADYGRAELREAPVVDPTWDGKPGMDELSSDLKPHSLLAFAIGFSKPDSRIGVGAFYRISNAASETKDPFSVDTIASGTTNHIDIESIEVENGVSVIGAMLFLDVPLSGNIRWNADAGLGKATQTREAKTESYTEASASGYSMSGESTSKAKVESSGWVFVAGTGIDWFPWRSFGFGLRGEYLAGSVDAESGRVSVSGVMNGSGKLSDEALDKVGNDDISMFGASGGVRLLF